MERPGAVNKKFKTKFIVTKFFILIKSFCISEIFILHGLTYKTKNSKKLIKKSKQFFTVTKIFYTPKKLFNIFEFFISHGLIHRIKNTKKL